ncbi:MAG: NAD(P)/FAD-dependent oxidoreductase [Ancrocorticia populi]|uniref:NAD(P)/FAD-dependent oxidoreductase n=1 Tax=Ancrocorticia populi TaxID=2175228 RepID=UPI003F9010A8
MTDAAEVVVVGGGPAGASAAYYLAMAGHDVLVVEKATFPRDKICGDGLTPRAVAELIRMGVDTTGWARNTGLRTYGGGHCVEVPWPELASMPNYGLAAPRETFDDVLIEKAKEAGARLEEGVTVTGPIRHERTGRVIGVTAKAGPGREPREYRAPFIIDAGGVSARLATTVGRQKAMNRPMGVAYRTYFQSPQAEDSMMESHLELWEGTPGASDLMPGYGWIFAVGDGLVNVGLGSLSSNAQPSGLDYRAMFANWMANVPAEWGFTEENQVGKLRGAALPMAFNRKPHYADGLLLVGDAGGMVSPFNGEGIAYALQSGRMAADSIGQALARPTVSSMDAAVSEYPRMIRDELGGYYSLGRIFAALIERPEIMHLCVKYGLPRPTLMRFVMKLLSDCYDRTGGDWMDRTIAALAKAVPKA